MDRTFNRAMEFLAYPYPRSLPVARVFFIITLLAVITYFTSNSIKSWTLLPVIYCHYQFQAYLLYVRNWNKDDHVLMDEDASDFWDVLPTGVLITLSGWLALLVLVHYSWDVFCVLFAFRGIRVHIIKVTVVGLLGLKFGYTLLCAIWELAVLWNGVLESFGSYLRGKEEFRYLEVGWRWKARMVAYGLTGVFYGGRR